MQLSMGKVQIQMRESIPGQKNIKCKGSKRNLIWHGEGPGDGNRIVKKEVGIKEMPTSFLTLQRALSSAGQSAKL